MMYSMNVNVARQGIEIMRQGEMVAFQPLPFQRLPNPGKDALLAEPRNQEMYDIIHDLMADANDGCGREGRDG